MKLRHISAAATIALFLPFAASALTVEDIQAQISSLLSQIAQLQQQLTQAQEPTQTACTMDARICPDGSAVGRTAPNCEFAACPGETTPPATACPVLTRTLYRGISGTDVASLQASLGVSQTGYYGPMTEAAVQQVQVQEGIVSSGTAATTGYGSVGPKTRAALLRRCGGGGGTSQSFSASPTSGTAPLAVSFSARGGKDNYSVDFGDGSTGAMTITGPMMGCPDTQAGSSNVACGTYGLSATHTYTAPGTYTARLNKTAINTCQGTAELSCALWVSMTEIVGTVTITVGGTTSSGAPSISGLDAPTSLAIGQTGTWTVRLNTTNTGNLSYSVVWGDEGWGMTPINAQSSAYPPISTSGTFTHSYAQAGTYKPVFTVSNSSGSAQTSASVVVGNSPTSSTFSASPTSGNAPLAVFFSANNLNSGSSYSINFGDGAQALLTPIIPPCVFGADCSNSSYANASHTYTTAGTYTATLFYQPESYCPPGAMCPAVMPMAKVVGTVTITVGGTSACQVTDLYSQIVPGYVYYDLFMKVRNLPPSSPSYVIPTISITGADSWNSLGFNVVGTSGDITTLKANQTINGTGINYIMDRKYAIKPINNGTTAVSCVPLLQLDSFY